MLITVWAIQQAGVIDGIPVGNYSPWALVGMFVILIATGRLIPRRTYDDQVDRANQWMAEARIKDQQIQVKDDHIAELTEQNTILLHGLGPAVTAYMDALQHAGKKTAEEEKA